MRYQAVLLDQEVQGVHVAAWWTVDGGSIAKNQLSQA
jgi:hypothetical protein